MVDAYGDALFRYAFARVRDQHAAEDLVQETFVAVIESQPSFRGDSSELTWLIGILRHKLLDHLRKRGREQPATETDDAVVSGFFDDRGRWRTRPGTWRIETETLLEREEFWQVLERCITALPDRQAQAFCLKMLDGANSQEVCKTLGVKATNLCVLLHRARTRLRDCLEKRWFGQTSSGEAGR